LRNEDRKLYDNDHRTRQYYDHGRAGNYDYGAY
jgi:hypothetical protein